MLDAYADPRPRHLLMQSGSLVPVAGLYSNDGVRVSLMALPLKMTGPKMAVPTAYMLANTDCDTCDMDLKLTNSTVRAVACVWEIIVTVPSTTSGAVLREAKTTDPSVPVAGTDARVTIVTSFAMLCALFTTMSPMETASESVGWRLLPMATEPCIVIFGPSMELRMMRPIRPWWVTVTLLRCETCDSVIWSMMAVSLLAAAMLIAPDTCTRGERERESQ